MLHKVTKVGLNNYKKILIQDQVESKFFSGFVVDLFKKAIGIEKRVFLEFFKKKNETSVYFEEYPKKLEEISQAIQSKIKEEDNKVVLIENLSDLILFYGLKEILKFLRALESKTTLICVIHKDLHAENDVKFVGVGFELLIDVINNEEKEKSFICEMISKRKTSKILKFEEKYNTIDNELVLEK